MLIYYISYIISLLILELLDVFLLKSSMKMIDEAKADGIITDEEKRVIRYSILQTLITTIVVVVGIAVVIHFMVTHL